MSGYTRDEVIGKSHLELNLMVDPEDRKAFEQKLEQDGEVDGFEIQYRTKGGDIRDTLLAARPLYFMDEPCLVAMVKDISEMKRTAKEKEKLEKQLQHAQKMESMGTLAGASPTTSIICSWAFKAVLLSCSWIKMNLIPISSI